MNIGEPAPSSPAPSIDACRAALRANPRQPEVLRRLAELLAAERKFDQAIGHLSAALAIEPGSVRTLNALANMLVTVKRPDDAIALFLQAISLAPDDARLHANLALAYGDAGMFEAAEAAARAALAINPASAAAYNNLGCLYIMMARHRAALECLDAALRLDPRHAGARRNRALAHLALGDFAAGWEDYDWCAFGVPQPPDPLPRWNGQPLAGRRIVLTARQGLGDALQFIRYARRLAALDAHVILECPMPLLRVLKDVAGVDECVVQDAPLPPADLCVPLMALARIFETTVETIPAEVPYLSPEPRRLDMWRERLGPPTAAMLRVGLCWQGNPNHQWDRFRSVELARLAPLAQIPGLRLVSLQRGPGVEQIEEFQRHTHEALLVPTDGRQDSPDDLADSAAIMGLLDVIISIDSAAAHLAGALARPAWVPLSRTADWRWLTDRADTPWYPTMRLFRQQIAGDWDGVFDRVAAELKRLSTKAS